MKKIYFLLAFLSSLLMSQGKVNALSPGDIAILGYNINTPNQEFCFLLLTDIPSGTVINFTDFGWCSGGSYTGFQSYLPCGANSGAGSDGAITWTSTAPMSCGTQVRVQCRNNLTASAGTVTGLQAQGSINTDYMTLTTNGDQIFAFQGTLASPTFITGLNTQGTGWATVLNQCDFTSLLSTLPAGLNATNSMTMPVASPNNAVYNGTVTSGSPAQLKAAIFNNANWNTSETVTYTLPLAAAFSCVTCVAPAVTAHPPNRAICVNVNTTFSITATGTNPTYQWQENTGSTFTPITNGGVYSGATTATLTITGATAAMNSYQYRCVVTGNCGTANSNSGTLTVSNTTNGGTKVDVLCNGNTTGSATVVPSGGVAPYTYSWSPSGGSAATASNLAANTYTVTVTDNIGCQTTRSFTITQPPAFTVTPSHTNVSCANGANGTATVTVSGATSPYTYSWSPGGATAATISSLAAGTYVCTIKDANLCQTTPSITVTQPTALAATTSQTDVLCNGANTGVATVSVTAGTGTPPYTYSWSPGGATTASINNLTANNYTCTITDAASCQILRNVNVTQPAAFTVTPSHTNVSCNGGTNGTATVSVTGGTGPYTYSWSPSGGTGATANSLAAGTYVCTIKDANLCQTTQSITITAPAAFSVLASQTDLACNGAANGVATVTVTGATSPYTYSWSPSGGTGATASGLAAGAYVCTIKDANLCQTTRNFTLGQPPAFVVTPSHTNVTCNGGNNGTAAVSVTGAVGPYTYSWSPSGGTGAAASNLAAGTYVCTIKDANLCQTTQNITVTQPPAIVVGASADVTICAGATTGLISIATGGTPGYTYLWQPGNLSGSTQFVTPAATTQYIVTATDASNCTGKDTVVVTVAPNLAQTNVGGSSTTGTTTSSSSQTSGGIESYYNGACNLVASLQQNAALGNVTASVTVLGSVQVFAGRPYVARWYEIVPQNNVPGVVTLYFKQSDFNQYNAYASLNGFPLLPQSPTDQAGIDTLAITKISGGTLGSGTASLIIPSSVVWDAVQQYWKVTFTTPSFSQFFIHAKNAAGTPLPVAYSAFEAVKENNTALLSWTTATERNNNGFSIERGTDGKNFSAIGWAPTRAEDGNSVAAIDYRFTDKMPVTGMNYYRLQQKDKDGQSTYSIIRSLDFANGTSFTCYPNPATEVLTIEHQSATETTVHCQLIDVTSRVVYQQKVAMRKGFNKNTITLSGLPQGMYQLIIADNSGILFRSKIVKK